LKTWIDVTLKCPNSVWRSQQHLPFNDGPIDVDHLGGFQPWYAAARLLMFRKIRWLRWHMFFFYGESLNTMGFNTKMVLDDLGLPPFETSIPTPWNLTIVNRTAWDRTTKPSSLKQEPSHPWRSPGWRDLLCIEKQDVVDLVQSCHLASSNVDRVSTVFQSIQSIV
jgi:hypothetical protein